MLSYSIVDQTIFSRKTDNKIHDFGTLSKMMYGRFYQCYKSTAVV